MAGTISTYDLVNELIRRLPRSLLSRKNKILAEMMLHLISIADPI